MKISYQNGSAAEVYYFVTKDAQGVQDSIDTSEGNDASPKPTEDSQSNDSLQIDKQRKGTPGNNQAQNKQTRDVANEYKLNKEQQRELHEEVTGRNYTYKEIEEIARQIKEGW